MKLADALGDDELLRPFFQGDSWRPWVSFMRAWSGDGAGMSAEDAALYRQCTGRTALPTEPFSEATLICGRRAGKSRAIATCAVWLSAFRDFTPHLAPGEVATVAVIASDRKQARSVFRYITGMFNEVPLLADQVIDQQTESLTLRNRVVIEVATASFRVTRGYTFAAVLADEIGFWRDETSANPAAEILKAVRPGLATIPGSVLLKASSPYSRRGPLWDDFRRHHGQDDSPVLVWKAPSKVMNPSLPQRVIDEAVENDPDSAAAEYLAEFRTDLADFVSREVIDAAVEPGRFELPPGFAKHTAFVDPSGGSADSMTLAVAHSEGGKAVLDMVREARPPFSPDAVTREFCSDLRRYGIASVTGDRYGGEWPRERFRTYGVQYELASMVKSELYLALLPLLNSRRVELLDNPRLISQLAGLERRGGRGGRDSVDHGTGAHDDLANAAAGALVAAADVNSGYDIYRLVGMTPQ